MTTITLPSHRIPGEYVLSVEWSGRDEIRLNDRKLYGRTTEDDRREILNRLNAAQQDAKRYTEDALREARVESRIAYAYAMAYFDLIKDFLSTPQFDTFLNATWAFSEEVQYAAYMFHSEQSSGKQGYALAWSEFLRYNPQVDAILHAVVVAPRSL